VVEHGDLLSGRSRKRVVQRLDLMIQKNINKSISAYHKIIKPI